MEENTDWLINRENSIGNSKEIYVRGKKVSKVMEEDIKELREMIDSDIESVGGVEGFNNYNCANECIISYIDRILDILEKGN